MTDLDEMAQGVVAGTRVPIIGCLGENRAVERRLAQRPSFPLRTRREEDCFHQLFGKRLLVEVHHRGFGQPDRCSISLEVLSTFLALGKVCLKEPALRGRQFAVVVAP
jgi:hypothetical protein